MSPKKAVLKALSESHRKDGAGKLIRPAAIPGFQESPEKYQKTINQLLGDRLIEGIKDQEGRMALALNSHRMRDVERELRPLWAHPAVITLMALMAVALGWGLLA
ncbi:hypothetical protein ACFL0I_02870 [Gemmatimonadota bacterium]